MNRSPAAAAAAAARKTGRDREAGEPRAQQRPTPRARRVESSRMCSSSVPVGSDRSLQLERESLNTNLCSIVHSSLSAIPQTVRANNFQYLFRNFMRTQRVVYGVHVILNFSLTLLKFLVYHFEELFQIFCV